MTTTERSTMEGPLQFGRPVLDDRRAAGAQPGRTALVLSGGGARTAYQVGVLAELMDIRREAFERSSAAPTPFNIVVGTSAGAINAFAIAMMADDLDRAIERLLELWANIHTAQVVRSDAMGVGVSGARWLATFALGWALPRSRWMRPQSLLDNSPLSALLKSSLEEERLDELETDRCARDRTQPTDRGSGRNGVSRHAPPGSGHVARRWCGSSWAEHTRHGARDLPAVRIGVYAIVDSAGARGRSRAACRVLWFFRLA
jgi:hypothetical protein